MLAQVGLELTRGLDPDGQDDSDVDGVPLDLVGQDRLRTRFSSTPSGTSRPSSSTTAASWPNTGRPAEPGFWGMEGTVVIWNMPVSVCHQVSMIGQRSASWTSKQSWRVA